MVKTLTSPVTTNHHDQTMNEPLGEDALLYRRYTANWAAPDDRKVNPWDLNEPDPTDAGTMGTIPGPVIELNVGDSMTVHFRNLDMRTKTVTTVQRTRSHSLSRKAAASCALNRQLASGTCTATCSPI